MVTGQAPVTLELRNTSGKNTYNPRCYTHISQLTQFMPPPETYKSETGSSLRCARSMPAHTSHYSRLEKPTIPLATQKRLLRTWYITCSTYHYAYAQQTQVNWKEETKNKKEIKERKEKKRKRTIHVSSSAFWCKEEKFFVTHDW